MLMPVGGDTRLNVNVFVGMSESVADANTSSVLNSFITWFAGTVRTGALFTSVTVTLKEFVALFGGNALSVTIVVSVFVPGPCASVGVHRMIPFVSMVAPGGPVSE